MQLSILHSHERLNCPKRRKYANKFSQLFSDFEKTSGQLSPHFQQIYYGIPLWDLLKMGEKLATFFFKIAEIHIEYPKIRNRSNFFLSDIFCSGFFYSNGTIFLSLETPNPARFREIHFCRFSSYIVWPEPCLQRVRWSCAAHQGY